MSKHKLNNFAFYQKLKNVEDLHIYEKKEVRCGFSIYLTPALKLYSTTQSHQLAFKIVFIHEYHRLWVQDPFQCVELLEEIQNQTKCWRKKNAGTVQLVSGRVYLASSCGLPHLWGISIHPLFSATPTTKKNNRNSSKWQKKNQDGVRLLWRIESTFVGRSKFLSTLGDSSTCLGCGAGIEIWHIRNFSPYDDILIFVLF